MPSPTLPAARRLLSIRRAYARGYATRLEYAEALESCAAEHLAVADSLPPTSILEHQRQGLAARCFRLAASLRAEEDGQ